jgi:tetratricopeptide (TPR) repeat protein
MEDDEEYELCGTALHEAELLKLGKGDIARGQLVYAQREVERAEQAYGANDPNLALPLWSLADVYQELGRFEDAEPLLRRANDLTAASPPNSQLATRVYGYALRLSDRGKHTEAVPLYERALQIAQSVAAADALTMLLAGYAEALRKVNRSKEAEAAYQRILDLAQGRSNGAAGAFSTIGALQGIAESQGDQGRFDDAEGFYEKALQELIRLVGENGWKVGELLDDWAQLRRRAGQAEQANPLEVRALRVFRHHLSQIAEEDTHDPEIQNRIAGLTSRITMAARKAASERPSGA